METEEEIWKDIPGYEGYYQASNLGLIRSLDRISMILGRPKKVFGRVIRLKTNKNNGYRMAILCVNGERKTHTVHRLVAKAWHENPNSLGDVNHRNGDKSDNRPENLEWCSRSDNLIHAYSSGLKISVKGTRVWTNKLTEDQVREIFHSAGIHREIGERFGVKKACVAAIKKRRIWKHISMDIIIRENNY